MSKPNRQFVLTTLIVSLAWAAQAQTPPDHGETGRIVTPMYGAAVGETSIHVVFPEELPRVPVTFGIPLGQVASPRRVALLDETGAPIPADFTSEGNWQAQPARWTLVSCVVDPIAGKDSRTLTLRWGKKMRRPKSPLRLRLKGTTALVENTDYAMILTPQGITAMKIKDTEVQITSRWRPIVFPVEEFGLAPVDGSATLLHDGRIHKAIRFTSMLTEDLELHQEFRFYADSPYVRCDVRFINRTAQDLRLNGIAPVVAGLDNVTGLCAGLEDGVPHDTSGVFVRQEAFRWWANTGYGSPELAPAARGVADNLGEWLALRIADGPSLMLVFPHFQEMAAGDKHAASEYAFDGKRLHLLHYVAASPVLPPPDVRLREGMARTFTYWLAFDPPPDREAAIARAVKVMSHVVYDRAFLTSMGVFQEKSASHLFDDEAREAALYYTRARVPRAEYVRCTRGADPGPDKSGEGTYEVDLHAGGMVFGEVFQYFTPEPTPDLRKMYVDEIDIAPEHMLSGGRFTYRNGDIVLALYQEYLRSGDAALASFAPIHAQVFADVSTSHARPSNGLGHYYCDWFCNPYVYQRFEGLLLAALVSGDPWWFETAKAMADYCVRAWKDGEPQDGGVDGTLGGVQYRSAYIAKMLLRMYEVTGDSQYVDTAFRLARWIAPRQEPEGWWRSVPEATREHRNTPIFAGYTAMGLWPLYHASKDEEILRTLMKTVDYHLGMQETADGNNPGTFPNSYWYRRDGRQSRQPIPTELHITGNYATTSHWGNIMLQAYLATNDLDYFYAANAAWVGALNSQTDEGGVPLSNSRLNSVWSHVIVESLPAFAATAEQKRLPIVLGSKTGIPGTSFMGKGASLADGTFTFALKYKHAQPVPVRVFWPFPAPEVVSLDGAPVAHAFNAGRRVLTIEAPASPSFRTAEFIIRAG